MITKNTFMVLFWWLIFGQMAFATEQVFATVEPDFTECRPKAIQATDAVCYRAFTRVPDRPEEMIRPGEVRLINPIECVSESRDHWWSVTEIQTCTSEEYVSVVEGEAVLNEGGLMVKTAYIQSRILTLIGMSCMLVFFVLLKVTKSNPPISLIPLFAAALSILPTHFDAGLNVGLIVATFFLAVGTALCSTAKKVRWAIVFGLVYLAAMTAYFTWA